MTANLRYGAAYQTIELTNYLDFFGRSRLQSRCRNVQRSRCVSQNFGRYDVPQFFR